MPLQEESTLTTKQTKLKFPDFIDKNFQSHQDTFDIKNLDSKDAMKQLEIWLMEAKANKSVKSPDAVCLATCTK
jgi:pyridoxine/pyridoxamine 5'-phosphate oxidase